MRATHFGSLGVLEAGIGCDGSPVNLGLALHVLDDCVEQVGLLGRGLLAAISGIDSSSCLSKLGRHLCCFGVVGCSGCAAEGDVDEITESCDGLLKGDVISKMFQESKAQTARRESERTSRTQLT
jgi:hypothetical protein